MTAGKIDYVHLNPVRAGIVSLEELGDYRWTSHRLIRRPHQRGIVTIGLALHAFYGLRDDSAGWDAYEERLRFVLATEDRAATDEELFESGMNRAMLAEGQLLYRSVGCDA